MAECMVEMAPLRSLKEVSGLIQGVIELYIGIFKEKPWEENLILEEVLETFNEEFGRPKFCGIALVDQEEVIGFVWMYEVFKGDLQEGTRFSPELISLFEPGHRIFYLQQLGVKAIKRRQGIGEKLTRKILEEAKNHGGYTVILSTNQEAAAAKELFSKVGFKNLGITRPPSALNRTYWACNLMDL